MSVMKSRWIFPVSMLMVRLASIYNSSRSLVEGTLHGNIGLLMDSLRPFAVWCGWVCQVVTVLRSSLPQVR